VTDKRDRTAQQIMEVVPLVMRTLALEMRSVGRLDLPAHSHLLVILADGPHCLSELAQKHAVSLPTMSNSISTLVERGWVKRSRSPHDRRRIQVELTPAGRDVLGEMTRAVEERVARKLSCLSPAECENVTSGLEILRECFARMPDGE
jgi:DNA-binding MarR family transcriptional regulator